MDVFIIAEQFRVLGKLGALVPTLGQQFGPYHPFFLGMRGENLITASTVCLAFSLELYLKCLLRIEKKDYGKEHNLAHLFDMLGRRNKRVIKQYWYAKAHEYIEDHIARAYGNIKKKPDANFEYALSVSRNAFTSMRYIYENGIPKDQGWLAGHILECARQAILDKRPQWRGAKQISPNPEIVFQPTFPTH